MCETVTLSSELIVVVLLNSFASALSLASPAAAAADSSFQLINSLYTIRRMPNKRQTQSGGWNTTPRDANVAVCCVPPPQDVYCWSWLTEVSVEGDAAFRVINRRQQLTDPLWSLSFVETFPVPTLCQDVHTVWPVDRSETLLERKWLSVSPNVEFWRWTKVRCRGRGSGKRGLDVCVRVYRHSRQVGD